MAIGLRCCGLVFSFAEFWWIYVAFTALVLVLLALDLGVFHRRAHVVSFRESLGWSIVWVTLALVFNYGFYLYASSVVGPEAGRQAGLEFLTGYLVEKSLAVDNIFVFVLVFNYFGIPPLYQHRVLFYGVLGALVFRARVHRRGRVPHAVPPGGAAVRRVPAGDRPQAPVVA